jgi:ATP-dependent DNA helicase DinG
MNSQTAGKSRTLRELELEDWFAAGSPLASCLAGFAPRAGQGQMAAAIASAISAGDDLVVEAGTGTGKTLAYLVPALLSGNRVILSTGTKTLQDQLFHRDLPTVSDALGRPAKTVLLKGRSNYLCLHRLALARDAATGANDSTAIGILSEWSLKTRTGDIVEVEELSEDSPVWQKVTSTQENCLGAQCEFYSQCHVVAARQAAMSAQVIVVNHHLLLADLVLKEEGFGELLPGSDAVIVDEAHQFPDIAQTFFNVVLSSRSVLELANDIRTEAVNETPGAVDPLELADKLEKAAHDLRLCLPDRSNNVLWQDLDGEFDRRLEALVERVDALIDLLESTDDSTPGLRRCFERACALVERVESIAGAADADGLRWIGLSRYGFTLNFTPVDIAAGLGALLSSQACSWIFTSATLAVGEDFGHFVARLGLSDPRTLQIPSPFDYPNCGLLLLPPNLPDPAADGYTRALLDYLLPLLATSRGRAFLLFTSYRALNEAAACLRERPDWEHPLLVQGEAPRSKLLEQFSELDDPVLLGTASFWEGVDIRGDGLVLVAIDRLPFASPGDPLLKARLDAIVRNGGQPFVEYQLPQAVLALKQGVGRLIRDQHDYGVVVIGDPRLSGRSYGRKFLASLPPFPVTRDSQEAVAFLQSRHDAND